jgi:hypothetical protein
MTEAEKLPNINGVEMDIPNEVIKFVGDARVENADGVVCGDGRFGSSLKDTVGNVVETAGFIGELGEDTSLIMTLMAQKRAAGESYDLIELADRVVDVVIKTQGTYHLHTDSHADHDGKVTGCGHVFGMSTGEFEGYGLDKDEVIKVVEHLQERAKKEDNIVEKVLEGGHGEFAVFVVQGETHTLQHLLDDGRQAFVLDPGRAKERREAVCSTFGLEENVINELEKIKAEQDQVTNMRLAKGKPVYGVNVDVEGEPKIDYLGIVQEDGSVS